MQALTVLGAVAGSISAASDVLTALDHAVSTAAKIKDAPQQAVSTLRDVRMMRSNMVRFQQLLDSQSHLRDRGVYIPLDDTQNTFTDCITSLDELESLLKPLSDPDLKPLDLVDRLEWVMKDKRIEALSKRVHDAQSSLGLMLTILSNESLLEVQKALAGLSELTKTISGNVAHLNRRSISTKSERSSRLAKEDGDEGDDNSTIRPLSALRRASYAALVSRPDSVIIPSTVAEEPVEETDEEKAVNIVARFAFEAALESSRAYRRAPKWDLDDVSFRSSVMNPHAWSLFSRMSCLSLGDVSRISVIALPLFSTDLRNSQHYQFGSTEEEIGTIQIEKDEQDSDQPRPTLRVTPVPSPEPLPSYVYGPVPPTPSKKGTTGVLNTLRKALSPVTKRLDPDRKSPDLGKRASSPIDNPAIPYIPHEQSVSRSPFVTALSPTLSQQPDDARSIRSENSVHTLGDLSQLKLNENELYLFHSNGVPCHNVILESFDEDEDIQNKMGAGQLSLAASQGYLDVFRCGQCKSSLASISKREFNGVPKFEIWCGASACLASAELKSCPCHAKIVEVGLPTDKYVGCRLPFEKEIKCPRCFDLCPDCVPVNHDTFPEGYGIFELQSVYLKAQRWLFENVWRDAETSEWEKQLNYHLSQIEIRLRLCPVSNPVLERFKWILDTRQRILNWRKGILPTWREMNNLVAQGSDFYKGPMQNMMDAIEESDAFLEREMDQSIDLVPGLADIRRKDSVESDSDIGEQWFAIIGNGNVPNDTTPNELAVGIAL
ncbi:unnamed protein product [Clonostachys rosea]|uniref:Fungal N-terminal domain-containing protein n=1 Tax=Bionectria ochroleuca TaxID=29856 RepID=A0ABY6UZN8_BIOOC|nr:unnamed protein product [Clonostachys rosea]